MNERAPARRSFFSEVKRRNVLRAAALYAGAVWVISQGIAQLSPAVGLPDWATRAFLVAAALGFPFWLVFAWIYEITPQGIRRESEVVADDSAARQTSRKLDFAIIAVLVVAVILLLGNQFLWHKGASRTAAAAVSPAVAAVPFVPTSAIPKKSVAVLPFANESGKSDEQFFSDGLSEDLITALSQFAGLKVISRNSAFQFRDSKDPSAEIGKLLGVAHLLEGSVQRAGDEVRITATLVNAGDGSIVWSQRYDKPYKDLFALQDAITKAVADALEAKLLTATAAVQSDRPPSGSLAAYAAYQHGNFEFSKSIFGGGNLRAAIGDYETAVRLDPHYARAYAAMSQALAHSGTGSLGGAAQREIYAEARAAADRALQLEPDLAAAYVARGYLLAYADFDWVDAEADFHRALQLAPSDGVTMYQYAQLLSTLGQQQRALEAIQRALKVDPRHGDWYYGLSEIYGALGRPDEARQAIGTAIMLQPGAIAYHEQLAVVEILRGDAKAALAAAKQEPSGGGWNGIAVALALQIGPDRAAADAALKKLIADRAGDAAYQIAQVYALRKDPDDMFKWLDRAWRNRDPGISYLLGDPLILRYRNDPRFAAFCKKVGLPTTTDAVAMK